MGSLDDEGGFEVHVEKAWGILLGRSGCGEGMGPVCEAGERVQELRDGCEGYDAGLYH